MDQSTLVKYFTDDIMNGMERLQNLHYQTVLILKPRDGPMEVIGDNHLCDFMKSLSNIPFTDTVPRRECRISIQPTTTLTLTKPPYFERKPIGEKRRFLRELVSSLTKPKWNQGVPPDFWPSAYPYHDPSKGYTTDEITKIVDQIYDFFKSTRDLDIAPINEAGSDGSLSSD